METAQVLMDTILAATGAREVYTYPGTPPQHLYRAIRSSDASLEVGVREQHLLHLAQSSYYDRLADGEETVPVVIVSGGMGEAMAFQPVLAGSISSPCLVIVAEGGMPHVDSAEHIDHQTDRGTTRERIRDPEHLEAHENVDERMLFRGLEDADAVRDMIDRLRAEHGTGLLHVPLYALGDRDEQVADILADRPESVGKEELERAWQDAERPMLLIGRGCMHPDRRETVEALAAEWGAPIATTVFMDGRVETNHVGQIGPNGTPAANEAFFQADCVVALGASIRSTTTSNGAEAIEAFRSKVIQVEEHPRRRSVFARAWFVDGVDPALTALDGGTGGSTNWFEAPDDLGLGRMRRHVPEPLRSMADVIRDRYTDTVTFGVSNAYLWMNAALGPDVRKEVSRAGSMGEAVMGLQRDNPLVILGDGGFEMDLSLLTEAIYRDTGATIVVVNNRRLGLVTEGQVKRFGEELTPKRDPIDYAGLAEAFPGVSSASVADPEEAAGVLRDALQSDMVTVIEVRVDDVLDEVLFDISGLPRLRS